MYIHIHVYIYRYMCICIYIYMYTYYDSDILSTGVAVVLCLVSSEPYLEGQVAAAITWKAVGLSVSTV